MKSANQTIFKWIKVKKQNKKLLIILIDADQSV